MYFCNYIESIVEWKFRITSPCMLLFGICSENILIKNNEDMLAQIRHEKLTK